MAEKSLYEYAHLVVSAIRVLEYKMSAPPALEDVSEMLETSVEEANRLCRKLKASEIIELLDKAGSTRLFVKDHLKIEELPKASEQSRLASELEKFKQARQSQKVALDSVKTEQSEKKKKLHEELEKKLKEGLKK
ncbi:MAG: hypothetical protein KGY61_03065 [Desulfobacterales bacterium]|nr:hypothetical protein [Desulfobacterales bacterium]